MGCISNALRNQGYFEVVDTTNGTNFISYLQNLKNEVKPECKDKRLVLVMDNHSAHKGVRQIEIMNSFCSPEFIPPYSCELNMPIERFWSCIKSRVLKKFTALQLRF